jgi:hypothetical protein
LVFGLGSLGWGRVMGMKKLCALLAGGNVVEEIIVVVKEV